MPFFIVKIETLDAPPCLVRERIQVSGAWTVDTGVRNPIRHRLRQIGRQCPLLGAGVIDFFCHVRIARKRYREALPHQRCRLFALG